MKTSASPVYLVTGAAGFIGARFVESCRSRGIPIASVDVAQPNENAFTSRSEHTGLDFGEVIDRDALKTWLSEENVSAPRVKAVIHLGACSDTTEVNEDYLRRVNIEYSQALWNYCARHGVPLVYASSAATYGAGEYGYDDDESLLQRLEPLNLYGWSKQRFDLWALEQEQLGNTPPTWAGFKFFNVYGFGERHKGRMASVVLHSYDQIIASGRVRLFKSHRDDYAHGEQKRDFIFVDDVIDALHFAAEGRIQRGIFNLGTGSARTFLDLARATFRALHRPEAIDFIDTPEILRNRYQYFTQATMTKLIRAGYTQPFTPLETGIARYVQRLETGG